MLVATFNVAATNTILSPLHFCQPTEVLFGCGTYTSTGVYYDTIFDVDGTSVLQVRELSLSFGTPSPVLERKDTVPVGTEYLFGCQTLTCPAAVTLPYTLDIVSDTLVNATGCDSIINLHLTFVDTVCATVLVNREDSIYVNEEYLFGCQTLTSAVHLSQVIPSSRLMAATVSSP